MSSLNLVVILAQCRYTKTVQRIFKYTDIQYTSLTLDKILNSLVYRTLFYVNQHMPELQTSKNSPTFLAHPVVLSQYMRLTDGRTELR